MTLTGTSRYAADLVAGDTRYEPDGGLWRVGATGRADWRVLLERVSPGGLAAWIEGERRAATLRGHPLVLGHQLVRVA